MDGKIDGVLFGAKEAAPALKAYGDLRGFYGCQATLYGTTTMLGGYAGGRVNSLPAAGNPLPKEDWINVEGRDMGNFIVSVDPKGELAFSSHISEKKGREPAHIIEALTEQACPGTISAICASRGVLCVRWEGSAGLRPAAPKAPQPVWH